MTNLGASSSALAQDLATQSQNPIASLISVPFEFDSNQNVGEDEKTQNIILAKLAIPIDITDCCRWNWHLL